MTVDPDAAWWWRTPSTGKPTNFDQDAARERAGDDDPNPKKGVFFAGPNKVRFADEETKA